MDGEPGISAVMKLPEYQRRAVEAEGRFQWHCWSRQSGKSFAMSLRRILRGLLRGRNQIFLSAGERQSRELMQKAAMHCQALKVAFDWVDGSCFQGSEFKQLEMVLPNRVRIIGLPANPQTGRGFTGDVLLDEFAMHREDREIWAAIFPSVLRQGGELDVASTPQGNSNLFAELRYNERFQHTVITLPEAIGQGLEVEEGEIRAAINDDLIYRQEFLCEFLDESSALFTYEQIAGCEDGRLESDWDSRRMEGLRGEVYVGVDIGRQRDLTVIWVVERRGEILSTVGWIEMERTPFREQYAALAEIMGDRRVKRCCVDGGGIGMQIAEEAVAEFGGSRVEAVVFTGRVKEELAGAMRRRIEERTIRIPVDERVRSDWHSLRRTMTAAGHVRYDAQRSGGSHADRFWAAALAVHAAGGVTGALERLNMPKLQFARRGVW